MAAGDVEVAQTSLSAKNGINFTAPTSQVKLSDIDYEYISLCCWVKPINNPLDRGAMIAKRAGGITSYVMNVEITGALGGWIATAGGATAINTAAGIMTFDEWAHVVMTYDGTNIKFYKNGALVKTQLHANPGVIAPSADFIMFGIRTNLSADDVLIGSMAEVKIYNRALTDDEIEKIYTREEVTTNGLVGAWDFNGDYTDSVGTNNGTATDMHIGIFDANITNKIRTERTSANDHQLLALGKTGQIINVNIEE